MSGSLYPFVKSFSQQVLGSAGHLAHYYLGICRFLLDDWLATLKATSANQLGTQLDVVDRVLRLFSPGVHILTRVSNEWEKNKPLEKNRCWDCYMSQEYTSSVLLLVKKIHVIHWFWKMYHRCCFVFELCCLLFLLFFFYLLCIEKQSHSIALTVVLELHM